MKSVILSAALAATTLFMTAPAQASAFTDGEEAVEYRQAALSLIRENFAFMASMVRNDRPYDAAMFEKRAQALYHLTYIPWDGFDGAGANVTTDSDALPGIWENKDDFDSRAAQLREDARALAEAAASGDMGTIRPQFLSTARNCQQCHENYRAD